MRGGEYWEAVEELFADAAGLAPRARADLLRQRRDQDPQLVAEVESLLAAHSRADQFLNTITVLRTAYAAPRPATPRVENRTIGHYSVYERLGAGGMGEVYRADDLALGRQVALKLLPHQFSPELRVLLLREADASARLQHPFIATFYEAGEAEGEAYIAMELVEGQLLRQRLANGPLQLDQALRLTQCLLEGLGHAHAAGLLHRDIKPENIIIAANGAAKLLDFGIAKRLFADSADAALTAAGAGGASTVVGTPGYFAPEQILGLALDPTTDLYQVALVLFEMLTGASPFPGSSVFERLAAMLTRPANIGLLREAAVPEELISIVERALAREPSERYQSAAAMLRDLASVQGTASPLLPTLAVVDWRELEDEPRNAWIGSGIAERLADDLGRVAGLTLIERERVLRATRELNGATSQATPDPAEIGRLIGCHWVTTGSYSCTNGVVRLTASLIDVTTGHTRGLESIETAVDKLLDAQSRLGRLIAHSLNVYLPDSAATARANIQAFECYARGRRLWQRLEKGTLDQARELYLRAIELEPEHAGALSGLAAVHAMRYPYTTDPGDLTRSAEYASRAIAADATLGDPYVWLGYTLLRQGRFEEALDAERRAAELTTHDPYPSYFAGCVHFFAGRPTDAVPLLQHAIEVEPTHAFSWMMLGTVHTALGHFASARWCLERAIALEHPDATSPTIGAKAYLAECLRLEGRLEEARAMCLGALESVEGSDHMYRDTFRGIALCCFARTAFDQSDVAGARAALDQVLAQIRGRDRTLGGGYLVVQALAGLARAGDGIERFNEAESLFASRNRLNFALMSGCDDATTLVALARAAIALELPAGIDLLIKARDAGAYEARRLLESRDRGMPVE